MDFTKIKTISSPLWSKKTLLITASIIDRCNINCIYCCNHFPRKNISLDLDALANFIQYLKNVDDYEIQLVLIGGETMLHDGILELCKKLIDIKVIVFSNFSLEIERYLCLPQNCSFIFTWHSMCSNQFFRNLDTAPQSLIDRSKFIVMLEHHCISKSLDAYHKTREYAKFVQLKRINNTDRYIESYSKQQTDEYFRLAKDNSNERRVVDGEYLLSDGIDSQTIYFQYVENINPFNCWQCLAGKNYLAIDELGNIHKCQMLSFYDKKSIIGNIYSDFHIKQRMKPCICSSKMCCNYEVPKTNVFNKQTDVFKQLVNNEI